MWVIKWVTKTNCPPKNHDFFPCLQSNFIQNKQNKPKHTLEKIANDALKKKKFKIVAAIVL